MHQIVVVGASLAGVSAIEGLRDNGFQGDIALVGAEVRLPYDRPPLSKVALTEGPSLDSMLLREPDWYAEQGVDLRLGRSAIGLNAQIREVALDSGEVLPYDGLVIATGSSPRRLGPPQHMGPIHTLRTYDDAVALHEQLVPGRHIVVIGGGFLGLEVAATAREMGLAVSVVERASVPLSRVLGDEVGTWFRSLHESHSVKLYCGAGGVDSIEPEKGSIKVRLHSGPELEADLVVAGIGVTPATEWLAGSEVELSNGVRCDKSLRTSVPGVVAAGDVARWHNSLFNEEMRVEQWTNAHEQGRHAAATLLGGTEAYAAIPYFWTDQYNSKMRFVGRGDAHDSIHIERFDDDSLVALFGRDGAIRGALCVNAPRQLSAYRQAILEQVPWDDVVNTAASIS